MKQNTKQFYELADGRISPVKLIAIGFWQSRDSPDLPHPKCFSGGYASEDIRHCVIGYLKAGRPIIDYMGVSYCRFGCGNNTEMGAAELSDGRYVWPEGLAHYVEHHYVRLPDGFIEYAKSVSWTIPSTVECTDLQYDFSYWKSIGGNLS